MGTWPPDPARSSDTLQAFITWPLATYWGVTDENLHVMCALKLSNSPVEAC